MKLTDIHRSLKIEMTQLSIDWESIITIGLGNTSYEMLKKLFNGYMLVGFRD